MNTELQKSCDRLIENKNLLKEIFPMGNGDVLLTTAALLSYMEKEIPAERIKECKALLKDGTSLFSEYRGNAMIPLVAYMASCDDPEHYLERIKNVYGSLTKFFGSTSNLMAALSICDRAADGKETEAVEQMHKIQKTLKEQYHWAVGNELIPYFALMATSGKSADEITSQAAACFNKLDVSHFSKQEKEALACVLSMDKDASEDKWQRISEQGKEMDLNKLRLSYAPDRILLGVLPQAGSETTASDIKEIDDYLKQKGCGWLNVDSVVRKATAMLLMSLAGGKKEDYQTDVLLDAAMKKILESELAAVTAGTIAASRL